MERVRLRFENIQQVVGNDDLSVIMLTDENRKRALSIICDGQMSRQLVMRLQSPDRCRQMLPEVLVQMLPGEYEIMIYGIYDGQYQVVLEDRHHESYSRLRISDAILLNIISRYPLYIEESLMLHQSIPFDENAKGVAIPINTMDSRRLNMALERAISEEDYELASQLRDELKRRKGTEE
jgi:hypothetical protein